MTIRLKLTLLYGALFVVAGLVLITTTYGLVRRQLEPSRGPAPITVVLDGDGDGEIIGQGERPEVQIARARREERRNALAQIWRQSSWALVLTTVGALALGWVLAGQVLNPIRRIIGHAQSSSATTLGERIRLEGPEDELKELADTFDAMMDRLQAAFRAQQGFAAQASHELRTPLAIIRAEAELARSGSNADDETRRTADTILRAVERSERLVDGLLALAQSESTMLDEAPLDLADLVGDVVGEQVAAADAAGIRLDLALDSALVQGDAALLTRMTANLVQNAINYNVAGGSVNVTVRQDGPIAELRVENSGPPMDNIDFDTLFQPFVRGDWARRNRGGGHGLGLAIVRSVATAHRGQATAEARPGGGLIVRVRIPVA